MFASGGGGCCDCGDPEAWTSNVYCSLHEPSKDSSDDVSILFESRLDLFILSSDQPIGELTSKFESIHSKFLVYNTLVLYGNIKLERM